MSPDSVLVVAITAFFVVAMLSILFSLISMEIGDVLSIGCLVVCASGAIGYAYHRVRVRRQARIIERELDGSR